MFDSGSKINAIVLINAAKLEFTIWKTNDNAQKFDGLTLMTYKMIIASFLLKNKLKKAQFFKETFLLTDTNIKIVFEMFFLIFFNTNVCFVKKKLV